MHSPHCFSSIVMIAITVGLFIYIESRSKSHQQRLRESKKNNFLSLIDLPFINLTLALHYFQCCFATGKTIKFAKHFKFEFYKRLTVNSF